MSTISPTKKPQNPPFKPGTLVEISTYDDGFRGSWYTGKIIKRASKSCHKYIMEYDKLFKDESGKKRLRESVDFEQLRPLAPREKKRKFKFGERVDAYHSDGWWEGSITEECKDGKFAVFFRGSREQLVFGEEDLRLHREWVDGQWKPPLEMSQDEIFKTQNDDTNHHVKEPITVEMKENGVETKGFFSKGMDVEVSSNEDGFQGAWFAATVVEPVGKQKYLVEYKSLRTEDDTDFLKEKIDTAHIRPKPPEISIESFKRLDEVDASYNDGWWVGVISRVLAGSNYEVYFKDSDEEMTFHHSALRLHHDWVDGKWIMPASAINR